MMEGMWDYCRDASVPTGTIVTDLDGLSNFWDDFTTGGPIGVVGDPDGDGNRRITFWGPAPGVLTGRGFAKDDIIGVDSEGGMIKAGGSIDTFYTGKAIIGRAINANDMFVQIQLTFPNIHGVGYSLGGVVPPGLTLVSTSLGQVKILGG